MMDEQTPTTKGPTPEALAAFEESQARETEAVQRRIREQYPSESEWDRAKEARALALQYRGANGETGAHAVIVSDEFAFHESVRAGNALAAARSEFGADTTPAQAKALLDTISAEYRDGAITGRNPWHRLVLEGLDEIKNSQGVL